MNNFATGLLGALSGGAQQGGNIYNKQMEEESKIRQLRSIEEIKAEIEQKREARLEEHHKQVNTQIQARAGELANKERNQGLDDAARIYSESGVSEEDKQRGLLAVEAARKNPDAPTSEHLISAAAELGHLSPTEQAAYLDKREGTEYARSRDQVEDAFKQKAGARQDRELELRAQQLRQSIASAALAAADAKEARANKKALTPLYEQYGVALVQESNNPGSMEGVLQGLAIRIQSLGGNVENMNTALLGKPQKASVTVEKENLDDGTTTKTTQDQVVGRSGGVVKPNNNNQRITSRAEYDKLPVGAVYIGTDGKRYVKGK